MKLVQLLRLVMMGVIGDLRNGMTANHSKEQHA